MLGSSSTTRMRALPCCRAPARTSASAREPGAEGTGCGRARFNAKPRSSHDLRQPGDWRRRRLRLQQLFSCRPSREAQRSMNRAGNNCLVKQCLVQICREWGANRPGSPERLYWKSSVQFRQRQCSSQFKSTFQNIRKVSQADQTRKNETRKTETRVQFMVRIKYRLDLFIPSQRSSSKRIRPR
jgi:hypothetical protein